MSPWFLRLFNIGIRILGFGFLTVGIVFIALGLGLVTGKPETDPSRIAPTSQFIFLAGGLFTTALGLAFLRIRAWRPDLGDSSPLLDAFGAKDNPTRPRSWLTGDPKERT